MACNLAQAPAAAAANGPCTLDQGFSRPIELGSERFSAHRLAWEERLAASGRQLLGLPQAARRALAAAATPAASPAASPLASVDSRPCQAIQDAAAAGTPINFTSVEAFCLNQVLASAA